MSDFESDLLGPPPDNIGMIDNSAQLGGIQAAIARTATRGIALYFARPVRLFRPSKVSGWQTLKNLAKQQGTPLTYGYIVSLVKLQGFGVIPKHFVPPMLVNTLLGTVLWQTYGAALDRLEPDRQQHTLLNVALCGGTAGACQAIVAAPAENVRLLLEHGFGGNSWSCAWKEVFQMRAAAISPQSHAQALRDIRQLRGWFQEVGQMAGRGWNGWGWGCGKDACGFAIFFLIFELSRRTGSTAKDYIYELRNRITSTGTGQPATTWQHIPAIANGLILVTGGAVAGIGYEYTCRPWDMTRRLLHIARLEPKASKQTIPEILRSNIVCNGISSFFRLPNLSSHDGGRTFNWNKILRTLGRVGPWGIGFLVWEACGQGLS